MRGVVNGCVLCEMDGVRDHGPISPSYCASCGEPYDAGCPETHHHSAWIGCVNYMDIRRLWCGCYAHKECQKSGNLCLEHGYADDMLGGADQLYAASM